MLKRQQTRSGTFKPAQVSHFATDHITSPNQSPKFSRKLTRADTLKQTAQSSKVIDEKAHDLKNGHQFQVQAQKDRVLSRMDHQELEQVLIKSIHNPLKLIREYMKLEERNNEEAWHLLQLLRNFRFFRQYMHKYDEREELAVLIDVCKRIKYQQYSEEQVVIRQGDTSDGKVYLVLTGDLNIFVKDNNQFSDNQNVKFVKQNSEEPQEPQSPYINKQLEKVKGGGRLRRKNSFANLDYNATSGTSTPRMSRFGNNTPGLDDSMSVDGSESPDTSQISNKKSIFANESPRGSLLKSPGKDSQVFNFQLKPLGEESQKLSRFAKQQKSEQDGQINSQSEEGQSPPQVPEQGIIFRKFDRRETLLEKRRDSINQPTMRSRSGSFNNENVFEQKKGQNEISVTKTKLGILVDKIYEGSFFGERAPRGHRRRATCVSIGKLELLIISPEDYALIKSKYDKTKIPYFDFAKKCFDLAENEPAYIMDAVTYVLDLREYKQGDTVTTQGEDGHNMFLVYEGECEVRKTVILDNQVNAKMDSHSLKTMYRAQHKHKENYRILKLQRGSYFGLELIGNENGEHFAYEYTVKAVSEYARILAFNRNKILVRFPSKIIDILLKIYAQTKVEYTKIMLQRIEAKRGQVEVINENDIFPIVKASPRKKGVIPSFGSHEDPIPLIPILTKQESVENYSPVTSPKGQVRSMANTREAWAQYNFYSEPKRSSLPIILPDVMVPTPEPWIVKTPPLTYRLDQIGLLTQEPEYVETFARKCSTPRIAFKVRKPLVTDDEDANARKNTEYFHFIDLYHQQKRFGFVEEAVKNPEQYVSNIKNFKLGIAIDERLQRKYDTKKFIEANLKKDQGKPKEIPKKWSPTQVRLKKLNTRAKSEVSILIPPLSTNTLNTVITTTDTTKEAETERIGISSPKQSAFLMSLQEQPQRKVVKALNYLMASDSMKKPKLSIVKKSSEKKIVQTKGNSISNYHLSKIQNLLMRANAVNNQFTE